MKRLTELRGKNCWFQASSLIKHLAKALNPETRWPCDVTAAASCLTFGATGEAACDVTRASGFASLQRNISFRLRQSCLSLSLSHAHTHSRSLSLFAPVWQPYALAAYVHWGRCVGTWTVGGRWVVVWLGRWEMELTA